MKLRAVPIVLAIAVLGTASPAFAQSAKSHAGASYFCTNHPNASQCQKRPPPVYKPPVTKPHTGAGGTFHFPSASTVVSVQGSPRVSILPPTGGAVPSRSNADQGWLFLLAALMLAAGGTTRLAFRRT